MMQVAVNYSAATAGLYKAGRIQVDRYKCPDWPDLISSAQRILPAVAADPANGDVLQRDNDGGQDGPGVIFVGIDICEDGFLNRGLGTEALKLWVDHLFAAWQYHRIGLDTWSFNPRMIRVAEKMGFVYEGRRRRMRHWQGKWLDSVHFGLLREEWQGGG